MALLAFCTPLRYPNFWQSVGAGTVAMRYLSAFLAIVCSVPSAHGQGVTLQEARQRLLRGNYAEARAHFEALAKDTKYKVAATVGIYQCFLSEGEYDKALAVVDAALKADPDLAALETRRGEVLYLRGRWDDAEKALDGALSHDKEQFLAHWIRAQIYRDRGDLKKAGDDLVWFVRTFANRGENITDPEELLLVGLAEVERARWDKRLLDSFRVVLNDVWTPLFKKHPDFWPAEYEAGRLFLEKYNFEKALPALDKVLAINPRAAEAMVSKGVAALERFDLEDAEQLAERALKVNPRLTSALRLQTDILLIAGAYADALKVLEKATAVNPREEATLARIAACHLLQGKEADFKTVVDEVRKYNSKCGLFYAELAEKLDERKWYPEAEKFYKQALKLRPQLTTARNHLGLLYMRLGQEDDAKTVLEEATQADPFNVRVVNSLRVLDHLESYDTLKTDHFLVRFDPKHDKALGAFVAKYLEKLYADFADLFQYRPDGPFLIEILNNHDMFSGRVTALPDLRTIGACTGRMVAMCSPRDKAGRITQPFNWARVLRHELVHVFNLEQTNFKVPHWFTEGLAVSQEGFPMPPIWYELLKRRVGTGELMNLDNIHLGFIRPASGEEWQLAYLQSFQYVEYLKKTYGKERIGDFLKAFGEGKSTDFALTKYCAVSKADFEKGYRQYLEELVRKFAGKPAEKVLSFKELETAVAKDPGNADLNAKLAERYLLLGDKATAEKLAAKALEAKGNQPLATYVRAQMVDRDMAVRMLDAAVDRTAPNLKVLRLLGKLRLDAKEYDAAASIFELGRKAEPYESVWLIELAKIYKASQNTDKLIGVLIDLVPTNADDLEARKLLAQLLLKAGRNGEAERYAREALEIDVLDATAQQTLDAALRAQNKIAEADELRKLLTQ
jgi:cellulose synthase operon protein C